MSSQHPREYDCGGDAAAYALGALDEHELPAFLAHLDGCAVCRDEVASLQVVADMLPVAVTPVTAPRGLRRRVLATVYEEAELFQAAGTRARQPAPKRRRWRPVPRAFQGLGGAALVAAGIGVGAVVLNGPAATPRARIITASTTMPATTAQLRISGARTELDVANLPAPASGRVYEVWLQAKGQFQPTDALFTPTSSGRATVAVPGSLRNVDAVLVTDEPAGGSAMPSRAALISASLE